MFATPWSSSMEATGLLMRCLEARPGAYLGYTDRLCSAVRRTVARMPGGKIRRQESSNTMGAAMIGMIWTAKACDEHGQQFAGMPGVPYPAVTMISKADPTSTFGQRPATRK